MTGDATTGEIVSGGGVGSFPAAAPNVSTGGGPGGRLRDPASSHAAQPDEGPMGHPATGRRPAPIAELAISSMAAMLAGGVYLAAHLPKPPPLGPAVGLLIGGSSLTALAVFMLARLRPFAWHTFFLVGRWAFAAYVVIAGLLGFVFVFDGTRGAILAVLVLTLLVFAIDVPMIVAFTVARHEQVEPLDGTRSRAGDNPDSATVDT